MLLSDLFSIEYGNSLELNNQECVEYGVNFVSRTRRTNGVSAKIKLIDNIKPFEAGTITTALSGSVLSTFVQHEPFYTGFHISCLTPKQPMTMAEKLFYCVCIEHNKYRYSFGRQANKTLMGLELPDKIPEYVTESKLIDYSYLDNSVTIQKIKLNTNEWKQIKLKDLFDVVGSTTTPVKSLEFNKKSYPYITTKSKNNGCSGFYDIFTEKGNVLTIDSAVKGTCFYQEMPFTASDHIEKLVPKFNMNKYMAFFLLSLINLEQYRYSFGRKSNQTNIKNTVIKLPHKNNMPDWQYMEDYIKSLPYSSNLESTKEILS